MREFSKNEYQKQVERLCPPSPILKNCANAFWVGGLICTLGQLLLNVYRGPVGLPQEEAGTAASVSLIFLSMLLTGFSVYDDIARFAGAGTLVPITGFANAVVSPAMEFRAEGLVTGMAAKMFVISGPVIVYGTAASVVYGIVYCLCTSPR